LPVVYYNNIVLKKSEKCAEGGELCSIISKRIISTLKFMTGRCKTAWSRNAGRAYRIGICFVLCGNKHNNEGIVAAFSMASLVACNPFSHDGKKTSVSGIYEEYRFDIYDNDAIPNHKNKLRLFANGREPYEKTVTFEDFWVRIALQNFKIDKSGKWKFISGSLPLTNGDEISIYNCTALADGYKNLKYKYSMQVSVDQVDFSYDGSPKGVMSVKDICLD